MRRPVINGHKHTVTVTVSVIGEIVVNRFLIHSNKQRSLLVFEVKGIVTVIARSETNINIREYSII